MKKGFRAETGISQMPPSNLFSLILAFRKFLYSGFPYFQRFNWLARILLWALWQGGWGRGLSPQLARSHLNESIFKHTVDNFLVRTNKTDPSMRILYLITLFIFRPLVYEACILVVS